MVKVVEVDVVGRRERLVFNCGLIIICMMICYVNCNKLINNITVRNYQPVHQQSSTSTYVVNLTNHIQTDQQILQYVRYTSLSLLPSSAQQIEFFSRQFLKYRANHGVPFTSHIHLLLKCSSIVYIMLNFYVTLTQLQT